jgi:hypothetical protein
VFAYAFLAKPSGASACAPHHISELAIPVEVEECAVPACPRLPFNAKTLGGQVINKLGA